MEFAPNIFPSLAALALASLFVLVSNYLPSRNKLFFQIAVVVCSLSVSLAYIKANSAFLANMFFYFAMLDSALKFFLTVAVICIVYVGAGFYAIAPVAELKNDTPASSDYLTKFNVPDHLPENDTVFFEDMLTRFTAEIVADLPTIYEMPQEAVEWVQRMIPYTVAGGKMNRGLAVLSVQRSFAEANGVALTNKARIQSAALGWALEFLQGFFLVADDVMDQSPTRRGLPCWYKRPEVGLIAINDSFILESCVFKILKKYFGEETYYLQLVDIFLEVTRQTEFGQLLDLTSQLQGGVIDLSRFTLERYTSIVKYKTAFYSFYLPVAVGMIVSGISDRKLYDIARSILCDMGEYFQVQDDYLDCYGSPEVIGKVGTDIQDNKCSWLIVQALIKATPTEKKILQENYGRHDEKCIAKVKKLYVKMGMTAVFEEYEENSYKRIKHLMNEARGIPSSVFEFLLSKIYKRSK